MFPADRQCFLQIAIIGNVDPAFTLNRLDKEPDCVRPNGFPQRIRITVWNRFESRGDRTESRMVVKLR